MDNERTVDDKLKCDIFVNSSFKRSISKVNKKHYYEDTTFHNTEMISRLCIIFAVATVAAATTVTTVFCEYKGQLYSQGQQWYDGCDYSCECLDTQYGKYVCKSRCQVYLNVPKECVLIPDQNDPCCKILKCNTTFTISNVTNHVVLPTSTSAPSSSYLTPQFTISGMSPTPYSGYSPTPYPEYSNSGYSPTQGATSVITNPGCVDHDLYCGILIHSHFCKNIVVQIQCPKTCNMCGHHQVSSYKTSTPTTMTSFETTSSMTTSLPSSSTIQQITTDCFDIDPDCFTLLKTHYCTEEIAKRMCAATCNICVIKTTLAIVTTKETTPLITTEHETTPEPTEYETTTEIPTIVPTTVQTTVQTTDTPETTSQESTLVVSTITTDTWTTQDPSTQQTNVYNVTEETIVDTSQTTSSLSTSSVSPTIASTVTVPTPPATLPSLKPFIPSVNNCFDKDSGCKFLVDSVFCVRDPLVPRVCPVACGACVNTTSSPTLTPEPCVDLDPTCENLHNISHLCEAFGLIRKQCPKSCHMCSQSTSTTPQTAVCMDYDPECPSLKPFCASRLFVKKLCPKMCGVCQAVPVFTSSISPAISASSGSSASLPPSTTRKSPPFVGALSCRTCEDPLCGMGIEANHLCPVHAPFCMNIVGQDSHHIPTLTKRCASESQCEDRWLKGSALNVQCLNLNLNSPPEEAFLCTFCCATHECNIPAVPRTETLYRGRSR